MEAAAIGQIAARHEIPYLTIKDISNNERFAQTISSETCSDSRCTKPGIAPPFCSAGSSPQFQPNSTRRLDERVCSRTGIEPSLLRSSGAPDIRPAFAGLDYSAALLGYGSDVLGYDTIRSTDHGWGPRLILFLEDSDHTSIATEVDLLLQRSCRQRFADMPSISGWAFRTIARVMI